MGTRGLLLIKKDGKYCLAQYNHCDSYPKCLGYEIVSFFNSLKDWDKFKKNLKYIKMVPKYEEYDPCINTLEELVDANEKIAIKNCFDFIYSDWCEWAYVIDFDLNVFEIYEGTVYSDNGPYVTLPSDRFYTTTQKNENNPRLLKQYKLDKLPKADVFLEDDFEENLFKEYKKRQMNNKNNKKKKRKAGSNTKNNKKGKKSKIDNDTNEDSDKIEWIQVYKLSNCKRIYEKKENYCSSCGKKMC